uniref:Olfactomedin-like domain-containing protein n=1 Tax=Heterorhabditis bacteriophora TaxID=37862 RepID=A0A1I7WYF0_HETBA
MLILLRRIIGSKRRNHIQCPSVVHIGRKHTLRCFFLQLPVSIGLYLSDFASTSDGTTQLSSTSRLKRSTDRSNNVIYLPVYAQISKKSIKRLCMQQRFTSQDKVHEKPVKSLKTTERKRCSSAVSFSEPRLVGVRPNTIGSAMRDGESWYITEFHLGYSILQFTSLKSLNQSEPRSIHTLPYPFHGTDNAVLNGTVYYNYGDCLISYHLTSGTTKQIKLSASMIISSWSLPAIVPSRLSNALVRCGLLYATESTENGTTITPVYDFYGHIYVNGKTTLWKGIFMGIIESYYFHGDYRKLSLQSLLSSYHIPQRRYSVAQFIFGNLSLTEAYSDIQDGQILKGRRPGSLECMGRAMRVVVAGSRRVGKTAILRQVACVEDITSKPYDPTIDDTYQVLLEEADRPREILIFHDTGGVPDYGSVELKKQYLQVADAFVLVYSVTDHESFNRVDLLKKFIEKQFSKDRKEVHKISHNLLTKLFNLIKILIHTFFKVDSDFAHNWAMRERG